MNSPYVKSKHLIAGTSPSKKPSGEVKFFHVRRFANFEKECRYWQGKGWVHRSAMTMVPFPRWHKKMNGMEIIAFAKEQHHSSIEYGFFRGPLFKRS